MGCIHEEELRGGGEIKTGQDMLGTVAVGGAGEEEDGKGSRKAGWSCSLPRMVGKGLAEKKVAFER